MQRLSNALERLFPGSGIRQRYRDELLSQCNLFVESGYADPDFVAEITSSCIGKFWSRLSEALIFNRLREMKFGSRALMGEGPDFLLLIENRRVWIEVICPEPTEIPKEWLEYSEGIAGSVPHDAILLRWTSAIKAKVDRLMGSPNEKKKSYLEAGIVCEKDVFVIAVNGCRLRGGPFSSLLGISQFPYAAEAVFPIGARQVQIDLCTNRIKDVGFQERSNILKPNGASVPAYLFLEERSKLVSAIWAVDFNGGDAIGQKEYSALVHNPNASNPIPQGFLPTDTEYVAEKLDNSEYHFSGIKPSNDR
jgi:hypothetical protein